MKTFRIEGSDISDGYHTFDELYEHRCLLFIRLCLMVPDQCAWKTDEQTPGWFLLYWESDNGQISYHCPDRHLKLIKSQIKEVQHYRWDGHNSHDVLARLAGE